MPRDFRLLNVRRCDAIAPFVRPEQGHASPALWLAPALLAVAMLAALPAAAGAQAAGHGHAQQLNPTDQQAWQDRQEDILLGPPAAERRRQARLEQQRPDARQHAPRLDDRLAPRRPQPRPQVRELRDARQLERRHRQDEYLGVTGQVVDVFNGRGQHQRSRFMELRTADGQRIFAEVDPRDFDPPIQIDRGDYVHIIGQPTRVGDQPVLDAFEIMSIGTLERRRQQRIRQHQDPLQRDLRVDPHGLRRHNPNPEPLEQVPAPEALDLLLANDLIGLPVVDYRDARLGTVDDLVLEDDPRATSVTHLVLELTDEVATDDRRFMLVPLNRVQLARDGQALLLDVSPEEFDAALRGELLEPGPDPADQIERDVRRPPEERLPGGPRLYPEPFGPQAFELTPPRDRDRDRDQELHRLPWRNGEDRYRR